MRRRRAYKQAVPVSTSATVEDSLQSRPFIPPAKAGPESAASPLQPSLEGTQELELRMAQIDFTPRQPAAQPIQPKLTVGAPGDPYEQEADRVAEQVVQQLHTQPSQAQANPDDRVQRQLRPGAIVQRWGATGGSSVSPELETSIQQARGSGQPLDTNIRQPMERSFGADFSSVRVHTDAQADDLNRSLLSRAFTTQQDVFFKRGEYNPSSRSGQELIAHELTHVVQQTGIGRDDEVQTKPTPSLTPPLVKLGHPNGGSIQRVDESLRKILEEGGDYALKDPFMTYTKATNTNDKDVDWKAHVGVKKSQDRAQVIKEVAPILKSAGISHKFDIKNAEVDDAVLKFLTIYPPADETSWAPLIANIEKSISVITLFDENTEKGVMGGKVAMRHGQINALTAKKINEAGIEITSTKKEGLIQWYTVNDPAKVSDPSLQKKFLYHSGQGTFFFMVPGETGEKPYPAIIFDGILRPDPRKEWNPFGATLPTGVKTTEEIEWDRQIDAYHSSSRYQERSEALKKKRGLVDFDEDEEPFHVGAPPTTSPLSEAVKKSSKSSKDSLWTKPLMPVSGNAQAQPSDVFVQRKLYSSQEIQERAKHTGGKYRSGTWKILMEKVDEYNQVNAYDKKFYQQRISLLEEIQVLIKKWISRHKKKQQVIQELNDLYHVASAEKLVLEAEETDGKESYLTGGYVGSVPTLKHPPSKRAEVEGHKQLGSQGYKLHISYANYPDNVDKVVKIVLPKLQGLSRKIVQDPKKLIETQQNKFMAVYPDLTEVTQEGIKPYEGAKTTVKVTYYEADREAAESMATAIGKVMDAAEVEPGGAVPDEEKLNAWTYTRYGSFTGKKVYKIKAGTLVEESDLGR